MFETLSTSDYFVYRKFFATVYILWGVLWGLVVVHYGKASAASWRQQGGTWRNACHDFTAPIRYGWSLFFCKIGLIKDPKICNFNEPMPSRFTVGHHLRFSIFLGAIAPMVLGLLYFAAPRDHWTYGQFLLQGLVVFISALAAGGHLFIAYRSRPKSWMKIIMFASIFFLTAPWLFLLIGWP